MRHHRQAFLTWLLASTILVFVLSLGFAHAPQPFKRLGLFYAGFGVVCGLCMKWLAIERRVVFSRWLVVVAAVLVTVGGFNIGWQSYLKLKETRAAELREDPQQLAMLNMVEKIAGEEFAEDYQQRRRKLQPEFEDYLSFRVSRLGSWNRPWSLFFWLGEIAISTAIASGLILQLRTVQSEVAAESPPLASKENS